VKGGVWIHGSNREIFWEDLTKAGLGARVNRRAARRVDDSEVAGGGHALRLVCDTAAAHWGFGLTGGSGAEPAF